MKIKIKNRDIQKAVGAEVPAFPKYTTQLMNLANSNAQGTRPKVVGQLSNLIQEFEGNSLQEWIEWYGLKQPDAIDKAVARITPMIESFKDIIQEIDEQMIRTWVEDLVHVKTYIGLKFQEAILTELADKYSKDYSLSSPEDEAKGIDGYIGQTPISIKPSTYKSKNLSEMINVAIVYYDKKKDGVTIEFNKEDFNG